MKHKLFALLVSVAVIVSLILLGCAPEAAPPAEEGAPPEEEEAAPPAAPEAEVIKWRMQTTFSVGEPAYELTQAFCDNVREASNGRIEITLYPLGAIVSSPDIPLACGEGTFELAEQWISVMAGVDNVFRPLITQGLGMTAEDRLLWIYQAGGKELTEKALNTANLHVLNFQGWPSEVACGNKKFSHFSDFEGSKFRTGDPRLCMKAGITAMYIPLEDTFTALQTGAVDIAEFGSLWYNEGLGLTDITKYAYWPDFWSVHTMSNIMINLDVWNGLSLDLQKILEMSARANEIPYLTLYKWGSAKAMETLKEEGRIEFIRLPAQDFIELRKLMDEVELEEYEEYGGLTAEFYDSIWAFKKVWLPYREITKWWGECIPVEDQLGQLAE